MSEGLEEILEWMQMNAHVGIPADEWEERKAYMEQAIRKWAVSRLPKEIPENKHDHVVTRECLDCVYNKAIQDMKRNLEA